MRPSLGDLGHAERAVGTEAQIDDVGQPRGVLGRLLTGHHAPHVGAAFSSGPRADPTGMTPSSRTPPYPPWASSLSVDPYQARLRLAHMRGRRAPWRLLRGRADRRVIPRRFRTIGALSNGSISHRVRDRSSRGCGAVSGRDRRRPGPPPGGSLPQVSGGRSDTVGRVPTARSSPATTIAFMDFA